LHMTHETPVSLQEPRRIRHGGAMKKADVDMRCEHIDVAERAIFDARRRVTVMQELRHVVTAAAHHVKPSPRDGGQLRLAGFQPLVDLWLVSNRAVEPEEAAWHERAH